MAKQLMGAVVSRGKVDATFEFEIAGSKKTSRKDKDWPADVRAKADALMAAAQAVAGDLGTVASVQVYSPATDPDGTDMSAPGDLVDIQFRPGSSPQGVRIGDDEAVPAELAAARDALKSAVAAAL